MRGRPGNGPARRGFNGGDEADDEFSYVTKWCKCNEKYISET